MAKCPSCGLRIEWDASECPKCSAVFAANAAWYPKPESPEEESRIKARFPHLVSSEPPTGIGRIALANVSLGIAFGVSALLAPGRILELFIDRPLLQSLGMPKAHLLSTFANYWLPALLIYLVLRMLRVQTWLKSKGGALILVGVANALLIAYVTTRIMASSIVGGGPSFVVASFAPLVVFPSWLLLAVGLTWLVAASAMAGRSQMARQRFTASEFVALAAVLAVPTYFAWHLTFAPGGPLRVAREAQSLFESRCQSAGEKVIRAPAETVSSLYLEPDGGAYYDRIERGVYAGSGGSILGEPLVNGGLLLFFERKNQQRTTGGGPVETYTRHYLQDRKGQPASELASRYGVFTKSLTTKEQQELGIGGAEIRIVDLKTQETIAHTTYFTSARHRRFCGHAPGGNFNTSAFVIHALGLSRQFPSAFQPKPETGK